MADVRPDVHQRDVLVAAVGRQRRGDQAERLLRRVRLDVHDARLEAGGLGDGDAVLDLLLARRSDQHLDLVRVVGRGADRLEIEVDLVERKRDVLVGFGLDRQLEILLALACGDDDLLGDDHRGRQRERALRLRLPRRFQARFSTSLTSSRFRMLPSATTSLGSGSIT